MKGTLYKTDNGWFVRDIQAEPDGTFCGTWLRGYVIPLHPDDLDSTDRDESQIEFDFKEYYYEGQKKNYAKIVDVFDEDHALDLVMNSMLADIEKEDLITNKTSVEQLVDYLKEYGFNLDSHKLEINKFLQLEKQQIIDACKYGFRVDAESDDWTSDDLEAKLYYKETFK